MAGENVKAFAEKIQNTKSKASRTLRFFIAACDAAIKALTNLSNISTKTWVFGYFWAKPKVTKPAG
ncbi:hypothetical protein EZ449_09515 [Pedobacter frigidisoli]|uniref:Uncharacterized protein n=1 Tax=Pedobacter frigidisoli TaxID=2530455 RepID=A0A4R0P4C2_9SPHI|nr:hypothetical protein [Pedobacter frigidisoli]TCD10572.1 hypothetical protein EZ449_09515 [Pedobacter frigidisoli]